MVVKRKNALVSRLDKFLSKPSIMGKKTLVPGYKVTYVATKKFQGRTPRFTTEVKRKPTKFIHEDGLKFKLLRSKKTKIAQYRGGLFAKLR